jgi:hypothetical protein
MIDEVPGEVGLCCRSKSCFFCAVAILVSTPVLALELKEDSPEQRCDTTVCIKSCGNYAKDGSVAVAVCKDNCAEHHTYCQSHDGTSVQPPDIAGSTMRKMEYLFCVKKYQAAVAGGFQAECDKIRERP